MGSELIFKVGDLIQGGSYPEAIWEVHTVWRHLCTLNCWYVPEWSQAPRNPDCIVPMRDFYLANEMFVLATSIR